MSKQFWGVLLVIAAIFVGVIVFSGKGNDTKSSNASPTNHVEGTSPTNTKLVEYGDYQCPICGLYYSSVKQAVAAYNDKVVFQFRNLPLTSLHPNAFAAARAAEAAGYQNKYYEMHDMLYENQSAWSNSKTPLTFFSQYASSLGMNVAQFKTDYASSKTNNAINADVAAFEKTGDDMATPTFYLDGKKVDLAKFVDSSNQPQLAKFKEVLDAALAAKEPKS